MADARIWIALAALLVLAVGCLSLGINSAFAPLCAVGGTVLWFTLWGCFGLLQLGGYLYYVLVVLVLALLVYRHGIKRAALPRVGAGFWFFAATSVVAMLLLAHSQPQFISWDEFSLWGTAVKLTKLYNQTYSAAPVGWGWPATHPPAFINMGYFFQFFGAGFAPWQVYAAGNVFQFAALAALLYPFEKRGWNAAVPLSIAALLVPYLLVHYTGARIPSPVYMTALPDIACGLWFAAGLACCFARPKTAAGMVPLCICLATLTLTKDLTGLLLALVVVGVLLLDAALGGGAHKGAKAAAVRVLRRCAAPLASVLAAYMGWSVYLGATLQVDRTNLGGTGEFSMFAAPFVFFKDLFAPVKSEYFTTVTGGMVDTFFKVNTTLLGTGAMVVAGACVLIVLAAVLGPRAQRRQVAVAGVGLLVGFAAYYFAITLAFLYILRQDIGAALSSYERYIYPYYIAWVLAALLLLGRAATSRPARSAAARLGKAALLVICCACMFLVQRAIPPVYSILGAQYDEYTEGRQFEERVEGYIRALPEDSKTFLVFDGDDGDGFFRYCYQLLPRQVDHARAEEMVVERVYIVEEGRYEVKILSRAEWSTYLAESGCTHVLIDGASRAFREEYGPLFRDGMEGYFAGEVVLYRIDTTGALTLVPMG